MSSREPRSGIFRAILWRELRAGIKGAVAGFVVSSAAIAFVLRTRLQGGSYDNLESSFDITPVLAPLMAILIGVVQTILESRGDRWAFLTHRPATRSTLFWGKAVAGLLLYTGAIAVPLAVATLWLATPGNVAMPFSWEMLLPGFADVLCGAVYYFATIFTIMRESRWYGSRTAGFGVAVLCSVGSMVAVHFWQAAAIAGVGILVAGLAAWGTFVAGGGFESQNPVRRAAVGFSVASGIAVAGFLGLCLVLFLVFAEETPQNNYTVYSVASDGSIIQTLHDANNAILAVKDLDGRPLERFASPESRRKLASGVVSQTLRVKPDPLKPSRSSFRGNQSSFLRVNAEELRVPASWFFIHKEGFAVGYDTRSKKRIGWIGPDGFAADAPPARRFEGPAIPQEFPYSWSRLAFPGAVYRVDLDARQMVKTFTPPPGEFVAGASHSRQDDNLLLTFGDKARFEAIATTKNIYIQSKSGETLLKAARDPRSGKYDYVVAYRTLETPKPIFLIWYMAVVQDPSRPTLVHKFDADGNPLATYTLPNDRYASPFVAWIPAVLTAVVTPLTIPVIDTLARDAGSAMHVPILVIAHTSSLSRAQRITGWTLSALTSLVCACIAFARGRAYAFTPGRCGLWTLLGFILGPAGIALMISLFEWPARETCPGCGRKRVVTNAECEHCGAPFAAPRVDGTEIFET